MSQHLYITFVLRNMGVDDDVVSASQSPRPHRRKKLKHEQKVEDVSPAPSSLSVADNLDELVEFISNSEPPSPVPSETHKKKKKRKKWQPGHRQRLGPDDVGMKNFLEWCWDNHIDPTEMRSALGKLNSELKMGSLFSGVDTGGLCMRELSKLWN